MRGRGHYRPPAGPPPYNPGSSRQGSGSSGPHSYPSQSYQKRGRDEADAYQRAPYGPPERAPPPLPPPPPSFPSHGSPYYPQQAVRPSIAFPPSAPRLVIRGDLPIETVVLIDTLAFYVAKSGPTVEEEITFREEANPKFHFITARAQDSAENAYYRWRLYSLLQGDTMSQWRQEPFQMERHPEAYVYVPPPVLPVGPECLQAAYGALRTWLGNPSSGSLNSTAPSASVFDEAPGELGSDGSPAYPPPSAYWLSRSATGEGKGFGTLSLDNAQTWTALLAEADTTKQKLLKDQSTDFEGVVSQLSEAILAKEAIARKMIFAIEQSQLSLNGIGGAAPHVVSLLLDAIVKTAYDAASVRTNVAREEQTALLSPPVPQQLQQQQLQQQAPSHADTHARHLALLCVVQLSHLFLLHDIIQNAKAVPLLTEEELQLADAQLLREEQEKAELAKQAALNAGGNSGNKSSSSHSGTELMTFGHGVNTLPLPPSAAAKHIDKRKIPSPQSHSGAGGGGSSSSASPLPVPAAPSLQSPTSCRSLRCILAAVEAILPTALEAVVMTALAAVTTTTSAEKQCNSDLADSSLQVILDRSLRLSSSTTAQTQAVFSTGPLSHSYDVTIRKANQQSGAVDAKGLSDVAKAQRIGQLLLRWLSQFLSVWANREALGSALTHNMEEKGKEVVTLRGRSMVLLLEKYEWLLPLSSS